LATFNSSACTPTQHSTTHACVTTPSKRMPTNLNGTSGLTFFFSIVVDNGFLSHKSLTTIYNLKISVALQSSIKESQPSTFSQTQFSRRSVYTKMMRLKPQIIIGVIVTIFASSAFIQTQRGWNNVVREASANADPHQFNRLRHSARTQEENEYVALDEEETAELYGFSSMEGDFEWNKFRAPRYIEHIHNDEQDSTFLIVPQREVERRILIQQRKLKTDHYGGIHTEGNDIRRPAKYDEVYKAGDVRSYSDSAISSLLHRHENVRFTQKSKGVDRLVVTQLCSIKHNIEPGAYFCVDHKTVCVKVKSIPRFYGDHVTGGRCGNLHLDDEASHGLSEAVQRVKASHI
jgi:hypothetical protein